MYGYNAETLFKAIKPELDKASFLRGGTAWLKFGNEKDSPEIDVEL